MFLLFLSSGDHRREHMDHSVCNREQGNCAIQSSALARSDPPLLGKTNPAAWEAQGSL
jgi:hypothetical protein